MNIIKKKSNKVVLVTFLVALALVASIAGLILYHKTNSGIDKINNPKEATRSDTSGEASTEQSSSDSVPKSNESTVDPKTSENSEISTVPLTITSANQTSDTLRVRVLIQTITSGGSCRLRIISGDKTVVETKSNVQPMSGYTTCMGFDVDTSKLERSTVKISVDFENSTHQGHADKDITLN
jgi:cytoskeletal protein RodZ